jgi:hypothetical protein
MGIVSQSSRSSVNPTGAGPTPLTGALSPPPASIRGDEKMVASTVVSHSSSGASAPVAARHRSATPALSLASMIL